MPHIMVEYSRNLERGVEIAKLVKDLHVAVLETGLFETLAVRTRALPRDIYRIADGAPENVFLHVVARIRAGRSVEDRKRLGADLLRVAKADLAALPEGAPMAISIEVQELDPEMLFRHITIK
jgi:5-carboxymethyl-2-hydroxymuconate isomerase